ncbi:MAG: LuxR C-terminal-related transcriptional regulator [Burkholderiaceae bacterium]
MKPIATAKLTPRLSSPRPVPRTSLLEQMHAAPGAALLLVHGPAGFGKTTAMLQYYAQSRDRGVATGWLTLDRADNDLSRLLRYLGEALRAIDDALAPASGDAPDAGTLLDVASRLSSIARPFALFLDDFELIESPLGSALVRQIIDYLPACGQLVIGSRTVPDIGLGRLRAHGRLIEIPAARLRFSAEEAASFLRQQKGFALRDADIGLLHRRTEGWPAALWLVSLALQGCDDPQAFVRTFDGAHASITDYLIEDVLAKQDASIRRFLLHSSVLQSFSAPLCDAVLERDDSQRMLAAIERAHLFLVPQDGDAQWWRYHPLFADFLRSQLRQSDPAAFVRLCRRAADWWLAQRRPTPAIEHLLQAGQTLDLLPMLAEHAETLLWQGRARTLARWYASVRPWSAEQADRGQPGPGPGPGPGGGPAGEGAGTDGAAGLLDFPALALVFAWALTLNHHYRESRRLLDAIDAREAGETGEAAGIGEAAGTGETAGTSEVDGADRVGPAAGEPPRPGSLAADTRAVRAFMLAMSDAVKASSALWRQCLLDEASSRSFSRAMLGASYGFCLLAHHRFDEAGRFLAQARRIVEPVGESFIPPMASCLEGAIDMAQGRRLNAVARFRAALAGRDPAFSAPAASRTVAAAFLAEALYEGDELDEAERLLRLYLPMLEEAAAPDQLMTAYAVSARIAFANGDGGRATRWLTAMELVGHRESLPRMVATARLERARIALLSGDAPAARDQIAAASDASVWQPFEGLVTQANECEDPRVAMLRWRLRAGQAEAVVAPLKALLAQARALHRHRRALKLNALLAEALWAAGQAGAGARRLHETLRAAAAEGFVRCFVDEGPALLARVAELRPTLAETRETAALAAFADRLLAPGARSDAESPAPVAAIAAPGPAAPADSLLSERERQVLELLARGHRNRAIADRLFVSETTVKAHLRSINSKLGAHSRTHAVALARERGLIG